MKSSTWRRHTRIFNADGRIGYMVPAWFSLDRLYSHRIFLFERPELYYLYSSFLLFYKLF